MVGNLFGLYYLRKQRKRGFLIGSVGCVGWFVFGLLTGSLPSIISNLIYIGMNISGWRKWQSDPPDHPE